MTPRTPQCKVFWALLSIPKHSGVPKDSKSPTLGVLGFTPTLGQSGVATQSPSGSQLQQKVVMIKKKSQEVLAKITTFIKFSICKSMPIAFMMGS